MSTDDEWERWGQRDPYFGVLTHEKFRRANFTDAARSEFLETGRLHVDYILGICKQRIDPAFAPSRVLDFGCGVGRVVIPFANCASEVVGVDVSPSMLAEARRNCDAHGATNVRLLPSDDALSAVDGTFDLVHSCIVLQHVELIRGRALFQHLVERIRPGGMGALQVTFAWNHHAATFGQLPPPPPPPPPPGVLRRTVRSLRVRFGGQAQAPLPEHPSSADRDPEMQMNFYNLSELMFIIRRAGVERVHTEITDHGGVYGAFFFFQMPA
jgi:SAM-dependent methyltransferase